MLACRLQKTRMATWPTDGYCSSRSRLWSGGSWAAREPKVASDPRLEISVATLLVPIIGISATISWTTMLRWISHQSLRCNLPLIKGKPWPQQLITNVQEVWMILSCKAVRTKQLIMHKLLTMPSAITKKRHLTRKSSSLRTSCRFWTSIGRAASVRANLSKRAWRESD